MNRKNEPQEFSEIHEHEKKGEGHHHRGKSSESLLDKAAILDVLRLEEGQFILDAGCGNGYMSKEFARLVGSRGTVYALDPDESAIAALRKECQQRPRMDPPCSGK